MKAALHKDYVQLAALKHPVAERLGRLGRVPAAALRPPWGHPQRLYLSSCEKRGRQRGGWPEVDSVSPFPQKQGMPLAFFPQLSSPTHLSMAIRHDLFVLPLLTAPRYSESNFTGSKLSRQLSKAENNA